MMAIPTALREGDAMDRFNRRDVIKLGAVGAAAGLGARGARPAAAAGTTNGVHIHATLLFISDRLGAPPGSATGLDMRGVEFSFNINIDVWGPDSDVSGIGWGARADPDDLTQPMRVDPQEGRAGRTGQSARGGPIEHRQW